MKFFVGDLLTEQEPRQTWAVKIEFMYGDGDAYRIKKIYISNEQELNRVYNFLKSAENNLNEIKSTPEFVWFEKTYVTFPNCDGELYDISSFEVYYISGNGYKYSVKVEA